MTKESVNYNLPDLDRFPEGQGRKIVTYQEEPDLYDIPYYLFVRLAKEAETNITLRKNEIGDVDTIEVYLEEHPNTANRVNSVRR